jgi:hypothetical protein
MFTLLLPFVLAQEPAPEAVPAPETTEEAAPAAAEETAPAEAEEAAEEVAEEAPAEAPAEELVVPETSEEVIASVIQIIQSAQAGNWTAAGALFLMLFVFVVRKFAWKSIPKKYIPYTVIGLAVAGDLGAALYIGADPLSAALSGLAVGLAAIGGWEVFQTHLKKLLPSKEEPKEVIEQPSAPEDVSDESTDDSLHD